jgi:hypothetical protein
MLLFAVKALDGKEIVKMAGAFTVAPLLLVERPLDSFHPVISSKMRNLLMLRD